MKNKLIIFLILLLFPFLILYFLSQPVEKEREISIQEILIKEDLNNNSELTKEGIIVFTNSRREEKKIDQLKENDLLNKLAKKRIEDMIEKNYFDHLSEKEFKKEAESKGYSFLLLGENIARGNFLNDQSLVEAWMDSPSHRENILDKRYEEIGLAIKNDLIIQIFGKPQTESFFKNELFLANITLQENMANFLGLIKNGRSF